ncbi:MAG TPA: hypothetical protein VD788_09090, partial [Candidatus Polarisedimenticolaceae bacterium]|nr:hypothetical protein [Candidatus Polarisedimenticolaceae bacterium]
MHNQTARSIAEPRAETPLRPHAGTPRRRLLADRLARYSVIGGGLVIIASILGILVFILIEVAPLVGGADVAGGHVIEPGGPRAAAMITDDYRTRLALLSDDGTLRVVDAEDGSIVLERKLLPDTDGATPDGDVVLAATGAPGAAHFVAATRGGRVIVQPVDWQVDFVGQDRRVTAELPPPVVLVLDPAGGRLGAFTAARDDDGTTTAAATLEGGQIAIAR